MKASSTSPLRKVACRTRASGRRSRAPQPRTPLRVIVAYADVPSARQAIARLTRQIALSRPDVELHPLLWRFQQLAHPRWREMALRDAAQADSVVLAVAEDAAFDASTDAWLHALAFRTGRRSVSVLAMIGETESWTITLTARPGLASVPDLPEPRVAEVFGRVAPKPLAVCAA